MRRVLLGGSLDGVTLSRRAAERLAVVREDMAYTVDPDATIVSASVRMQTRWWTWGGTQANALLASAISEVDPQLVDEVDRYDNRYLRLRDDADAGAVRTALRECRTRFGDDFAEARPSVSDEALRQLKFAELLPPRLAAMTLGSRATDHPGAAAVAAREVSDLNR